MDICLHHSHITPNIWFVSSFSQIPLNTRSALGGEESNSGSAAVFWSWPQWLFSSSFSESCLCSCLSLRSIQDFKVVVWGVLSLSFLPLTNESIAAWVSHIVFNAKHQGFQFIVSLLLTPFFLLYRLCLNCSLNMFPNLFCSDGPGI